MYWILARLPLALLMLVAHLVVQGLEVRVDHQDILLVEVVRLPVLVGILDRLDNCSAEAGSVDTRVPRPGNYSVPEDIRVLEGSQEFRLGPGDRTAAQYTSLVVHCLSIHGPALYIHRIHSRAGADH